MKQAFIILFTFALCLNAFGQESPLTDKNKAEPNQAKYTFLNGLNFDFSNTDKTNYVGHFNIYVPATYTSATAAIPATAAVPATLTTPAIPAKAAVPAKAAAGNKWGINTGILKISYMPKDSVVVAQTDNVLINPLDVIDGTGDQYNRQYNRYSAQTKASSFSLYVQPMYHINKLGTAHIYVHGHLELLMSKYETTTKIRTLQTEQITIADGDPIPAQADLLPLGPVTTTKTVNVNSGNFGAGLTFDFNFRDNCVLFFQATAGFSLNHADNFPTIDDDGNYTIATGRKSPRFYLVRTYFQYFTSTATQLVIGTDIRGYFPKDSPYTSVYIGINLGLDKIFSM